MTIEVSSETILVTLRNYTVVTFTATDDAGNSTLHPVQDTTAPEFTRSS